MNAPFFQTTPQDIDVIFDKAASAYDHMNNWMSLGLHHTWKDLFIQHVPFKSFQKKSSLSFLDMASGSGDVAQKLWQRSQLLGLSPTLHLADKNKHMLHLAKEKYAHHSWHFHEEDATNLRFKTHTFDLYTLVFGLRNMPAMNLVFKEALRVLKPGGTLLVMEFSQPLSPLLWGLYHAYLKTVIPTLGRLFSKAPESYDYLAQSVIHFPKASIIQEIMDYSGFKDTGYQLIHKGVVAIFWGKKPS